MRIQNADRVIGLLFLVIAMFGFYRTYAFPVHDALTYGESVFVTPAFYPRVVLVTLGVLAVFLIIKSQFVDSSKRIPWTWRDIGRVLLTYFSFLLYFFLMSRISDFFVRPGMGFVITSGAFAIVVMIVLGTKKYHWVFLSSFLAIGSIYVFFVLLLNIMLP
jgi:hypothetical protein